MLQIGDIVQLNSGGMNMVVISCSGDGKTARVKYQTEDDFPVPCLRKIGHRGFLGRLMALWADKGC